MHSVAQHYESRIPDFIFNMKTRPAGKWKPLPYLFATPHIQLAANIPASRLRSIEQFVLQDFIPAVVKVAGITSTAKFTTATSFMMVSFISVTLSSERRTQ